MSFRKMNRSLEFVHKIAVLSDIHSNYPALKACIDDAVKSGAKGFVFLGDYVSDLGEPERTLDLVYRTVSEYPTVCLRGNRERYMLNCKNGVSRFGYGSNLGSLQYTYDHLRKQDIDFFEKSRFYETANMGGVIFEIAHAAPDKDNRYFDEKSSDLDRIFEKMSCKYLIAGHSHRQYMRRSADKTIVNPGSVGVPHDRSRWPKYAMLEIKGGDVCVDLREIKYDISETIRAQFGSGLVESGRCWSLAILYDVITGEKWAMELLERMNSFDGPGDEERWETVASDMGIVFTEREMLKFYKEYSSEKT